MKFTVSWKVGKETFDATVNAKNGQDAIKIVKADVHNNKAYNWKAE
mgnify:CR=1 FL=1